jgi:hypothetical protein
MTENEAVTVVSETHPGEMILQRRYLKSTCIHFPLQELHNGNGFGIFIQTVWFDY